nr:toprim domain-containing protein [Salinivirgaceae bacterium]
MAFELQDQLLQATEGGLQIILSYYPQAADTLNSNTKKFSIRSERTPSCSLKKLKDGNWVVTDFGGDQTPRNGVQICMFEENITYREAMAKLCGDYKIGGIKKSVNKPDFEIVDAKPDQKDGEYFFEVNEKISESELKLLGPVVTQEACDTYNFYSLKSFTYIKNRKAQITTATENYPIFLIEHEEWKKIYQPLSFDKQFRFRYVGTKPKDLINGLDVLIKKNAEYQKQQMNELEQKQDAGEDVSGEIKKYPEAMLCSGETDALNLAGHGYVPLWLNSETAGLSEQQYKTIMKYCEILYYLPDIDKTGLKAATKLCLQHLEIKLIMLPESLKNYRDSRG